MKMPLTQRLKQIVAFVLIITMMTPTMALSAEPIRSGEPWDYLPVIEPYYIGSEWPDDSEWPGDSEWLSRFDIDLESHAAMD